MLSFLFRIIIQTPLGPQQYVICVIGLYLTNFICSVIPDRYTGNVNNIEPLTVIKYKMFSKQACVPTNS